MVKCISCGLQSSNQRGWYADPTKEGKIMRCPSCGEIEKKRREDLHGKKVVPTESLPKDERIEHAKELRDHGLSPWNLQIIKD